MPMLQENAWILDQQNVAQQTYRMRLKCPEIAKRAKAGQFIMLQVREGMDPLLRRPFSFHRVTAEDGVVEILYRVVGHGTLLLSESSPGTRVNLIGPLGTGFVLPPGHCPSVALVAGGIGIAPVYELMRRLTQAFKEDRMSSFHLFYGARTAAELLPDDFFTDIGVSIHRSTDDGSLGYNGYVTQLLRDFTEKEQWMPSILYSCGPLAMQYHVAGWAEANGVPSQLSLESLMACGLGACLGCALPAKHPNGSTEDFYVHVCKDGPIFPPGLIEWQKIRTQQMAPPISQCI